MIIRVPTASWVWSEVRWGLVASLPLKVRACSRQRTVTKPKCQHHWGASFQEPASSIQLLSIAFGPNSYSINLQAAFPSHLIQHWSPLPECPRHLAFWSMCLSGLFSYLFYSLIAWVFIFLRDQCLIHLHTLHHLAQGSAWPFRKLLNDWAASVTPAPSNSDNESARRCHVNPF